MENVFTRKDPLLDVINQVVLGEKKLTDAELKKREEAEQIDELSKNTLSSYHSKAADSAIKLHNKVSPYDDEWENLSDKERSDTYRKRHNRWTGLAKASKKLRKEEVEQIEEGNNDLGDMHDDAYEAAKKVGIKPHSIGKHPKHPHLIRVAGENGKGVYNRKTKTFHKGIDEEAEQIDELSKKTLGNYISKAVVDVNNNAYWGAEGDDKDATNKAFKRLLGVKSAAARLSNQNVSGGRIRNFRREEVDLEEQLENFWGAYLTCLDEAKDDASQQALLLRAMAKDPSDLMKMKRAISMGDKALTNPVMRQEILKMLDQMMGLTVNDPTLLQKAKAGFQKAKRLPEEVEELDELSKGTLGNYIKKAATGMNGMAVHAHMSGSASSAEQREKHFDKAFKRGKGIAKAADKLTKEEVDTGQDAARKKQPSSKEEQEKVFAKHKERMKKLASEEVEQIDELSKKTLGSYIKKASGEAVDRAHAQANAENRSLQFARWHGDKKWKRMTGIRKAADKLTKEEAEQVDEAGYDFTHYRKMQYAQTRAAQKADDKPPFEGGREVKSSKPAAERVKKIAKGMQKKYTKKD